MGYVKCEERIGVQGYSHKAKSIDMHNVTKADEMCVQKMVKLNQEVPDDDTKQKPKH